MENEFFVIKQADGRVVIKHDSEYATIEIYAKEVEVKKIDLKNGKANEI